MEKPCFTTTIVVIIIKITIFSCSDNILEGTVLKTQLIQEGLTLQPCCQLSNLGPE